MTYNQAEGARRAESTLSLMVVEAVTAAMKSPCQSKRGVVIWQESGPGYMVTTGYNDQPKPFICDGSDRCKRDCGKTAIHAEQSAILSTGITYRLGASMLHVKAQDFLPCASMAPSCLQCSKLILASGIKWMHLLHDTRAQDMGAETVGTIRGWQSDGRIADLDIRRYSAEKFHWLTANGHFGIDLDWEGKKAWEGK